MKLFSKVLVAVFAVIAASCSPDVHDSMLVSISGSAQKGPFTNGSQLTAFGLNDKLVASGKSFPGSITDDMGNFLISGEHEDPYLELRAEGYYFNELTGELSGPLYLEALLEPSATSANINILTTIIKQRVKTLILKGDKYGQAIDKAQKEFLTSLGMSLDSSTDFDQLDITKSSNSDALLLALSCMVQVENSPAQISALLQTLADDMKDGKLSDDNVALLWAKGQKVSVTSVTENITEYYQSKGVNGIVIPEFWKYLQPTGYGEVLSARVIKGVHIYHGREWIVIDDSLEDWAADRLQSKFWSLCSDVYFKNGNKQDEWCESNGEFNLSNPFEFYGDYSFEVTVLLKDGATVTSSVPWITVEETESLGEDRYTYKISVSSSGCKDQRTGVLSLGGNDYNLIVRNDIYHLSEVDWNVEYTIFDVVEMCHFACESLSLSSQKFEANFNGKEYPFLTAIDDGVRFAFMLVPREDVFETMSADEDNEIEIKCMSVDGVSVGYVGVDCINNDIIRPQIRDPFHYLVMRCPFASYENRFTPSPLNILTIEGKEYEPCALRDRYCLYAVESYILQPGVPVLISNAEHGNGTGVIQNHGVGDNNTGFRAEFQVENIQIQ